jgi:catechol 2,3-dioxygenase-like lactoylglutathione lyase family enzyme
MKSILGIHHITAIAGDPQQNIDFYTGVLGLRLVKITVNFDDPGSYHFYYGDGRGRPGTILTFFSWPGAGRGRKGVGQVTAASFAVPPDSLAYWTQRLAGHGIASEKQPERFGEPVLFFSDPDGLYLGLHGARLAEREYEPTAALLTEIMGYRLVGHEHNRFRYQPAHSHLAGAGRTIDVEWANAVPEGRVAVGSIHHIAFRTPDDAQQQEWLAEIGGLGYNISPVMDRIYFHSIYYREPGGILFEIATDSPGFATDEPVERLGEALQLPPWLETQRARIEASLPPIQRRPQQAAAR